MNPGSGAPPFERRFWLLLPPLLLLPALGWAPLFDVDEGAFAQATREMFQRGDFLSTWLDGRPRFDKPILIYWLQALSYALFGPAEWAFRLPSALAGCAWAWATWHFARPRLGNRAAVLAMLMIATMIGPWAIARAATADALLNLLLALTLFDMWRHWESGGRAALVRSYVWIGLGVLTKGPVAILIPLAATGLFAMFSASLRRWLRCTMDPIGWTALLLIVLPWYGWALQVHGWAFIEGFLLHHNVERFTATLHGHAGSLFYYVMVLPVLLLPWTGLLLPVISQLRTVWAEPLARLLLLWTAFVLVFFSMSGTKLPHYALYGVTPLALLMGWRCRQAPAWQFLAPGLLLLALLIAVPWLLGWLVDRAAGPLYFQAQLGRIAEIRLTGYWVLGAGALTLALTSLMVRCESQIRDVLLALACSLMLMLATKPLLGDLLQGPVKAAGLFARDHGPEHVWAWRYRAPSFSVYRGRPTPDLTEAAVGDWILTRVDRQPDLPHQVVFESGGVRLLEVVEPAALPDPD